MTDLSVSGDRRDHQVRILAKFRLQTDSGFHPVGPAPQMGARDSLLPDFTVQSARLVFPCRLRPHSTVLSLSFPRPFLDLERPICVCARASLDVLS